MTHAKEKELTRLQDLFATTGLNKKDNERMHKLADEKSDEVTNLAEKLRFGLGRKVTRV